MVTDCAHPLGPPVLADLIGLNTTMAVVESIRKEAREQLDAPALPLSKVEVGTI